MMELFIHFKEFVRILELTFQTNLPVSFEIALDKVTAALKGQGFGVLTKNDVQDTFKQKEKIS